MLSLDNYVDKNAIYCNDKEYTTFDISAIKEYYSSVRTSGVSGQNTSTWERYYNGTISPSLKCSTTDSQYTYKSSSEGNKLLNYSVGLITADEVSLVGGVFSKQSNTWFNLNSNNEPITDANAWWTMSPATYNSDSSYVMAVYNFDDIHGILFDPIVSENIALRPVISLKGDNLWKSGDGTSENPYEIILN